jgi:beta-barrel assembly-enhancing protease
MSTAPAFGRYSDGKSAAAYDCSVRLGLTGIEVRASDSAGHADVIWPFGGLATGEPLRPHAIEALITSRDFPGASLFVPDKGFAAALATRAPHLTARAERWRHARPWMAFAAGLVALIGGIYAAGWSPLKTTAAALPEIWRERLGQQALTSITENRKQCVAPDGRAALDRLTDRLSAASGVRTPFKVTVYDWSLMNAFAVPGNQIVLTRGLIEKAGSADEIAGVLAHEMGHGIELHPETGLIRAIGLSAAVELMMGGSGGAIANMGLILAQLGYTRAAEREADRHAILLLRSADISPQGLADFFTRVIKEEGGAAEARAGGVKGLDLLSTHPAAAERAALVRAVEPYPATPAMTAAEWADLQAICSVAIKPDAKPAAGGPDVEI